MTSAMRPLVLVGAGGLGRETAELVRAINGTAATWQLLGFVDDSPALAGAVVAGLPVLGPIASAIELDAELAVCTARPAMGCSRRRIVADLGLPSERFPTLVHPAASLSGSTTVGEGCLIFAGVVATADVSLGRHVVLMPHVVLTHDDAVEDFATFAAGVHLGGGVRVGAEAYLGAGVLVREQVSIGPAALVGMGSVVLSDVPGAQTWVGAPAMPLRQEANA